MSTSAPNISARLSSQVPLRRPIKTPKALNTKVIMPIMRQAKNGLVGRSVSVKPAAIASMLVAMAKVNITR